MANIYKDGVYYVDGKALNPPAVDPYEQMRKVGIDPNYKPANMQLLPNNDGQSSSVPLPPQQQQNATIAPYQNTTAPSGLNVFPNQQPSGLTPLPNTMPAGLQPLPNGNWQSGLQQIPNYGTPDPNARLTAEEEQRIRKMMGLSDATLSMYSGPGLPEELSVPMVNTPSPTNPGLPTGLSAPNQAQPQQVPVTTQKPTYTNVALQGDIPLGQLAQIGAAMPAGTTEQTPGFLGIMTNAVQQATAPAQTATAQSRQAISNVGLDPDYVSQAGPVGISGDPALWYEDQMRAVGLDPNYRSQAGVSDPETGDPATSGGVNTPPPSNPDPSPPYVPPVNAPSTTQPGLPNELAQMLALMPTATGQQTQQFMPTAANSALSNQLSAKATDLLNRDYGYTAAEQQAFRDSAMSQFNRTQDEDLRRLEGLYEQYGLNSGAGELGGQAGSSLQDYFGKRAQAQADIETGLQTYFAQKKSGDEQAAIQTATAIQNQIYNQVRGDYQDMLSYLQVNETIDNNAFQRAMSLAGFQSEEAQRDFLNQLGISDRESQDYWMGVETAFNQKMQGAEFNAAQIQQQFTNQMTAAGFDAQQSQWLFQNQATLAELASQMTQQEFENTMTAAGFTAQQAQQVFQNTMQVKETNFEQQITSQNLADQGLQMLQQMVQQGTISASDYMNLVAALTQGEQKQFTTAMNNDQNQMSNLLLPLTLMMNLLSQNANTGVNVNVNGGNGQGTTGNNALDKIRTGSEVGSEALDTIKDTATKAASVGSGALSWLASAAGPLSFGALAGAIGYKLIKDAITPNTSRSDMADMAVKAANVDTALKPMALEMVNMIPHVNDGHFPDKENMAAMGQNALLSPIALLGVQKFYVDTAGMDSAMKKTVALSYSGNILTAMDEYAKAQGLSKWDVTTYKRIIDKYLTLGA